MPAPAVHANAPASITVHFGGLRLFIRHREVREFHAALYLGESLFAVVFASGETLNGSRDDISPCLWLGTEFCIDLPEEALAAIERWRDGLPPRRPVSQLCGRTKAEPIRDAEAIVAAATAKHGAPCDVRC